MKKSNLTKDQARIKKIINKHFKSMVDFLNLQDWSCETRIMSGTFDKNEKAVMTNDIQISYLTSTISVFDPMYREDDDTVKRTLMHELCHIITESQYSLCRAQVSPHLHEQVEEIREQETERIARIAMKGYETSNL